MIKCDENDNGKRDHIQIRYMTIYDQDVDTDNIGCLGKTMSL